jgi:hypothetical protein
MGRPPVRGAAPLALLSLVRRVVAYAKAYLPLAASLSLLPAETFTL